MFGIPVPRYALVNREVPRQELDYFVEEEDFVEVHNERFWKPFVEKPVHGMLFIWWCFILMMLHLIVAKLFFLDYMDKIAFSIDFLSFSSSTYGVDGFKIYINMQILLFL